MSSTPSTPTSSGTLDESLAASSSTAVSVGGSTKLFINARLVGIEGDVDALLVKDGSVAWIGKETDAPSEDAEVIDVNGQWISPVSTMQSMM